MGTKHGYLVGVRSGKKRVPRTYNAWTSMKTRCNNPKSSEYKNYGGRGISVCKRWGEFSNFLHDMGEAPLGMEIERINNNFGYSPNNCRWATRTEQCNNQRKTRFIEYNGHRLSVSAWARKLEISRATLFSRIRKGYPPCMVLDTATDFGGMDNREIKNLLNARKNKCVKFCCMRSKNDAVLSDLED